MTVFEYLSLEARDWFMAFTSPQPQEKNIYTIEEKYVVNLYFGEGGIDQTYKGLLYPFEPSLEKI